MTEQVSFPTPATEKVPSIYHDAQSEPFHSTGKSPTKYSTGGSDGTAAPQYDEGPSSAAANTKHTIHSDGKEKHPLLDTKQPMTDAQQTVSPTTAHAPKNANDKAAVGAAGTVAQPQSAHDRAATAESGMSAEARANLSKSEGMISELRQMIS